MDPNSEPFVFQTYQPPARLPYVYFEQGTCRYGESCRDLHQDTSFEQPDPGLTTEEEEELVGELEKLAIPVAEHDDSTTCARKVYGSEVTFGAGATVTKIKLSTTFEYGKWIEKNVVLCTWFRPARMAYLTFTDIAAVNEAAELLLQTQTPSGRNLSCKINQRPHNDQLNRLSLIVRNLDLDCEEEWFKDILANNYPLKIKLKEPASDASPDEARAVVEGLLQSIGPFKTCSFFNDPKRFTLALSVAFEDERDVINAITELNGTEADDIGSLRLRRVVNVKFNVPTKIVPALLPALQTLQKESQLEYRVRLTIYQAKNISKPSQCLRIEASGTDAPKYVAKIKAELEKLLAGTVINAADAPLWHSFFGTAPGLLYLTSISQPPHFYIYIDLRKSLLLFYGGSVSRRDHATRVLLAKVADLNEERQTWVLTSEELHTALTGGGFSRLQEIYVEKVTFDVASNPKQIVIRGSRKDLQIAKSVFYAEEFWYEGDDAKPAGPPKASSDDCCLCMTEPDSDDLIKTQCNHIYCRGYFLHQVKSASNNEIPLRCHAQTEEGRCQYVFSLEEFRTTVDYTTFETLLETSFNIYVRSHPAQYQYCPTPDCRSIYGVPPAPATAPAVPPMGLTTFGPLNFFCRSCLQSICTDCKTVLHGGMTCPEYRDSLNSEANYEFMRENGIKECPR